MITIRLLGGAKKAVGKPAVDFDRPSASVSEILKFLSGISSDPRILEPNNLIIAVNGVDSAALKGRSTIAKSGDTVTIVTVVHGGTSQEIDGTYVSIIGVQKNGEDPGKLVDRLRADNKDILMQAANAGAVFGTEHALGALRIAIEAEKRKIMLANRIEIEVLVRLAFTGQISEAMKRAGLKKDAPGCFIAFSKESGSIQRFSDKIKSEFQVDDSVVEPSGEKKGRLVNLLGVNAKIDNDELVKHMLERAAILVK